MFAPKELITTLKAHFAQQDTYQLTGERLLEWLQDMQTATNMLTAVATDGATEAESQGLHTTYGCKDLAVLLRSKLKLNPAEAKRRTRLVHELPSLPKTREALHAGAISGEHALVISDAIKRLPAQHTEEADRVLAEIAPSLNPRELMYAGKRVRAHVDPDGVFKDEQEGVARRSVRMGTDQDGCLHLKATLDPINGALIKNFLLALAKPKSVNGEKDPRTSEQRLADGFIEAMTTAMSAQDLPAYGGPKYQLILTMNYEDLATKTGSGSTQSGDPASAGLVRQMACDAGIIPVVLGGESEPLDCGREKRLATPAQRRALAVRDKGCAFPGCDRPPAWTEAHHVLHWLDHHGPTDLDNLVLLCVHHHHVLHQEEWTIVFQHGIPSFIPPKWIDPAQKPLRNIRVDLQLRL